MSLALVMLLCLKLPHAHVEIFLGEEPILHIKKLLLYIALFCLCMLEVMHLVPWEIMLLTLMLVLLVFDRRRLLHADFLLLFTFGIWNLIWIYRTTRYLNCVQDEKYRNPATKLLLCMFVPFYSIYWVYQSARRIDKLAAAVGVVSDLAVVCLILEIFVPLIPLILMQDKINQIVGKPQ